MRTKHYICFDITMAQFPRDQTIICLWPLTNQTKLSSLPFIMLYQYITKLLYIRLNAAYNLCQTFFFPPRKGLKKKKGIMYTYIK